MKHVKNLTQQNSALTILAWYYSFYILGDAILDYSALKDNTLLYVWVDNTMKGYFGAVHDGEVYTSTLLWNIQYPTFPSLDKKLHNLIESGLTPYQALEIMEL